MKSLVSINIKISESTKYNKILHMHRPCKKCRYFINISKGKVSAIFACNPKIKLLLFCLSGKIVRIFLILSFWKFKLGYYVQGWGKDKLIGKYLYLLNKNYTI